MCSTMFVKISVSLFGLVILLGRTIAAPLTEISPPKLIGESSTQLFV